MSTAVSETFAPIDTPEGQAQRKTGIGASMAPVLCGVSPYKKSVLAAYLYYTTESADDPASPEMDWGNEMEEVIRNHARRELNCDISKPVTRRHPDYPFMYASPDGLLDNGRGLEIKNVGRFHAKGWGEPWTDECPPAVIIQCQQQAFVFDMPEVVVAACIMGAPPAYYFVRRSPKLIASLIDIERNFWNQVECRIPPPADWTDPRTPELIALLHRPTEGKEVELGLHDATMVEEYTLLGLAAKEADKKRSEIKGRLIERLGDAELGRLPGGGKISRKQIHKKAYEVGASSYFNFLISTGKGS